MGGLKTPHIQDDNRIFAGIINCIYARPSNNNVEDRMVAKKMKEKLESLNKLL